MTTILAQQVRIDGSEPISCTVSVNTEQIETTSALGHAEPDMSWTALDMHSHFHAWAADGTLPTLRETKKGNHRCVICREKVVPLITHVPASDFRTFTPGRQEIALQVVSEYKPAPIVSVRIDEGSMSGFGIGHVRGFISEGDRYEFEVVVSAWGHRAPVAAVTE
jgi:hypothetical protein